MKVLQVEANEIVNWTIDKVDLLERKMRKP